MVTVYRNSADVWFYVIGHHAENELILVSALTALYDALTSVLRQAAADSLRRLPLPPAAATRLPLPSPPPPPLSSPPPPLPSLPPRSSA